MGKIRLAELNEALRRAGIGLDFDEIGDTPSFGVYHVHEWYHGYDGSHGIVVYKDGSYVERSSFFRGTRRQFYEDLREMARFLSAYLRVREICELIVAPCFRDQFPSGEERNDIYWEIYAFLRRNGVRRRERSGIVIDVRDGSDTVEMIVEGGFRGTSELCFFAPGHGLLIAPSHHFELTFFTQRKQLELEKVTGLLGDHPDLRCTS
ncbi:MAG: hypothetical protein IJR14_08775 [Synergistaceae bacterium]|nr:hypothetical protein [Synergistaceae bacterium]